MSRPSHERNVFSVEAENCLASPESFSFTDQQAATVNKMHREKVRYI